MHLRPTLTWRCIEHSCCHSFVQRPLRMEVALRRAGNTHSMVSTDDIGSNCHRTDTPCSCFRRSCSSNCRQCNCDQIQIENGMKWKSRQEASYMSIGHHLPNACNVSRLVAILPICTDPNFSLTKPIDDEKEQRQRQRGRDATGY